LNVNALILNLVLDIQTTEISRVKRIKLRRPRLMDQEAGLEMRITYRI
jgi:hypothetical protein